MKGIDTAYARDHVLEGHRLRYYRTGEGDTVLLIHGITTYSFIWAEVFEALSPHYDVIAVDLYGCGRSDKTLEIDHSLKNHARLLWKFLDHLKVDKLHVIGHDVGGGITQLMMVSAPHRMSTITLINTVAYDYWPVQPIIAMRTPIIRQLAMASLDLGFFRMLIVRGVYDKDKVDNELMEAFQFPLQTREGRKAFLHFARCLNNQNFMEIEQQLRESACPLLVIRGQNDVYLSSSISDRLHSEIPESQLIKISKAGHFAMLDQPEQIVEAIQNFTKTRTNGSFN